MDHGFKKMSHHMHFRLKKRRRGYEASKTLSVAEFAKKYHLSLQGVRDRISTGALQGFKSGGHWYVTDKTL
jgi:hypothetical protein